MLSPFKTNLITDTKLEINSLHGDALSNKLNIPIDKVKYFSQVVFKGKTYKSGYIVFIFGSTLELFRISEIFCVKDDR